MLSCYNSQVCSHILYNMRVCDLSFIPFHFGSKDLHPKEKKKISDILNKRANLLLDFTIQKQAISR